jgi:hypothetical protein
MVIELGHNPTPAHSAFDHNDGSRPHSDSDLLLRRMGMSKHRARKGRAYAAGARDALDRLRDELRETKPSPPIMSSMDVLINRTRTKFPMPEPDEIRQQRERH